MKTGAPAKYKKKTAQEKTDSLRARLAKFHAQIPGRLFVGEWKKVIGSAYPLVGVLNVTCDWPSGIWRGGIPELAAVIGVTEKTIGNWLRQLKKINGFEIDRFPYSIVIQLPESIRPRPQQKNQGTRRENHTTQNRTDFLEIGKKAEIHDIGRIPNSASRNPKRGQRR